VIIFYSLHPELCKNYRVIGNKLAGNVSGIALSLQDTYSNPRIAFALLQTRLSKFVICDIVNYYNYFLVFFKILCLVMFYFRCNHYLMDEPW